jgi:hypothetical protein
MTPKLPRFDCHLHQPVGEGIIIGIEGNPKIPGLINNEEAFQIKNKNTFSAWYVKKEEIEGNLCNKAILKFHPRREKYSTAEVIACIEITLPKLVIFDTLNYPFWEPSEYFKIARKFPGISFLLAHAGGIQIHSFVPELILSNVYFDFSATMDIFELSKREKRGKIDFLDSAIQMLVSNPNSRSRLLFGSDAPMYSRENTFKAYNRFKISSEELDDNFIRFVEKVEL